MKTWSAIFALLTCILNSNVFCQSLIALHSGSDVSFYQTFEEAQDAAIDGDTLYLPARGFTELTIEKAVHVIGVGYDPDSTNATGDTHISGNVYLVNTSSGGSIEGLRIYAQIYFGTNTTNAEVDNFTIKRCFIDGGIYFCNGCSNNPNSNNNVIAENVLTVLYGYFCTNNLIANNVIYYPVYYFNNCYFSNNIFLYNGPDVLYYDDENTFENNIFTADSYADYSIETNVFNNNVFNGISETSPCDIYDHSNTCNNNIIGVDEDDFYEQWVDASTITNYYLQDFHLAPGSPATGVATDSEDCGIYNGMFPWKAGGLPVNPHIQQRTISNSTDENGDLEINIKVSAQDN